MSQSSAQMRGGIGPTGPQGGQGTPGVTGPPLLQLPTTLNGATQAITTVKTVTFTSELNNGTVTGGTTIDWTAAQKQVVTLNAATITFTFTAPVGVANLLLRVVQDGSVGGRLASWPASVKWVNGVAPTLSTATNAIDIISFYWNGTNYFGVASLGFA